MDLTILKSDYFFEMNNKIGAKNFISTLQSKYVL